MKDIDFDELDRAVSSAIGNNNINPVVNENNQPILTTSNTNRPSINKPDTGRFMDVVHPSSNMRNSIAVPERSRPVTPDAIQQPVKPTFLPPTDKSPNITNEGSVNDDLDIDNISDEINKTLNSSPNDLPDSPFLSDAKVTKRPLNAFSQVNDSVSSQSSDLEKQMPVVSSELETEKSDTPLPAELHSELLSIESKEAQKNIDPNIKLTDIDNLNNKDLIENKIEQEPAIEEKIESRTEDKITTTEVKKDETLVNSSPNQYVPTSINQQYTELPNTGDKEIGAIYDTNSYHKPMSTPVKKKSGWMWVVWIILLMIVSIGAGAAVYLFVLPQL